MEAFVFGQGLVVIRGPIEREKFASVKELDINDNEFVDKIVGLVNCGK